MFSSNDTPEAEFRYANEIGGIINLDDITHIKAVEKAVGFIPKTISCRYNPGGVFKISNDIMDNPGDAKFGMTTEQLFEAFKILKSKGLIKDAKVFVVQESLSNYKDKLQSGTYILNTSMTTDEMLAVLAREDMTGQPEQDSTDSLDTSADGTDVQTTEEAVTDEIQVASGELAGDTAE